MTGRFSFTDVTEPVTICDVNKYHKLLSVFQGRVQFPTGGTVRDLAVPYGGAEALTAEYRIIQGEKPKEE